MDLTVRNIQTAGNTRMRTQISRNAAALSTGSTSVDGRDTAGRYQSRPTPGRSSARGQVLLQPERQLVETKGRAIYVSRPVAIHLCASDRDHHFLRTCLRPSALHFASFTGQPSSSRPWNSSVSFVIPVDGIIPEQTHVLSSAGSKAGRYSGQDKSRLCPFPRGN